MVCNKEFDLTLPYSMFVPHNNQQGVQCTLWLLCFHIIN